MRVGARSVEFFYVLCNLVLCSLTIAAMAIRLSARYNGASAYPKDAELLAVREPPPPFANRGRRI